MKEKSLEDIGDFEIRNQVVSENAGVSYTYHNQGKASLVSSGFDKRAVWS